MIASFHAQAVSTIEPALMRDLETNKPFAVIRTSATGSKVWSFHVSLDRAIAAANRYSRREIRTR